MRPKSNVWKYGVVLVCVLVVILILGVWHFQGLLSREEKGTIPLTTEFYKGKFSVSDDPILNRTVELAFTLEAMDDAPNTTIKIFLPEGIELVEGNLVWNGDLKRDEKIEHKISIKVVKEGEWRIRAWVENEKFSGFNRAFFCYIDSDVSTGEIALSAMKTQESTCQKVKKKEVKRLHETGMKTYNVMSPGSAIVYGYIDYEDDAGHKHPVRYATVELWKDIPWWPDEKLATSHTDSGGKFEFNIDISGEINVYVKVFCEASAVKGTTDGGALYYGRIPNEGSETISEGTNYLGWWYFPSEYENWQAYDYVIDEYQWIDTRTGWTRSQVTVKWPSEHCKLPDGTPWPCTDGNTIYLPRKSDMQPYSPWQRPTVLHEYAHCVMYAIYGYFPNGCGPSPHYVNSESCEGFAVTEGWAEFLQCAVDNNPNNLADYTCGRYTNIEDNNWELGRDCVADNSGAIVEGAVASIWWDIFDSDDVHDPDEDELALGFDEIFNVIRWHKPNSINKFWDYWFQHYDYRKEMNAIYWSHGIDKNNPPSCKILSPNGGGWYSGTIIVSASASDSDGSVSQVEFQYSLDGVSWHDIGVDTNPSDGWSVSWNTGTITDSTVWVRARAKDNLGEYSPWDTSDSSFGVDNSPPSKPNPDDGIVGWTKNNDPTFTWNPVSDEGSGVEGYYYELDNPTPDYWTTSTSVSYTNLPDGIHTFYVRAKDKAGNLGEVGSHEIKIDTSPPGNWQGFSPSGWTSDKSPTCSIKVKDALSGLDISTAEYRYSTNGGTSWSGWKSVSCTGSDGTTSYQTITAKNVPFNRDSKDKNKIQFRIKDMAGNTGISPIYTVKIDTAKPPAPSPDDRVEGWSNDNTPTFTWSEPSDTSGIAGYYWKVDGGSDHWTTSTSVTLPAQLDGEHTFYVKAKDNAGNIGDYGSHKFKIDTTPPSSEVEELPKVQTSTTFTVSWEGSDALSGIRWYDVQYKKDNGPWIDWLTHTTRTSEQFAGERGHTYYFRCRAQDNAGNWEDYGEADTYTRVNSPPETPSNPHPPDGATDVPIDVDLSWSCSDPDGDSLEYDIYFGTYNPPPLVERGYASTTYDPGTLEHGTKYYWKVVARDEHGAESESEIWEFTTIEPPDWNPWDDPDSDGGARVTTAELQEAIHCWLNDEPAPKTGAEITTERLQEVIHLWLQG